MKTQAPTCWCEALPVVANIPVIYKDCLCATCLRHFQSPPSTPEHAGLIEGEDYYYDKSLFVFTEAYHLKKGSCCGNGCANCPY
jgi:hypothetical protein